MRHYLKLSKIKCKCVCCICEQFVYTCVCVYVHPPVYACLFMSSGTQRRLTQLSKGLGQVWQTGPTSSWHVAPLQAAAIIRLVRQLSIRPQGGRDEGNKTAKKSSQQKRRAVCQQSAGVVHKCRCFHQPVRSIINASCWHWKRRYSSAECDFH